MKKKLRIKEPIKLRSKQLSNGCLSLYLDIYMDKKRRYEFLKLYIIPENSRIDKDRNAETLKLANAIKAQKITALQNGKFGFDANKNRSNMLLTDYIGYLANRDMVQKAKRALMNTLIHHLQRYDKSGISLKAVDKDYILGFMEYLKSATQKHSKKEKLINVNSQICYLKELNYCLKYAVVEDVLSTNPMNKIKNEDKPKRKRTEREYLTMDEIRLLSQTHFYNEMLKRAFLFSCFCGLRHSDIAALTWENLRKDKAGNTQLHIIQQKTQEIISLPLSPEALKQLPERGKALDTERVFNGLISLGRTNEILSRWGKDAGIQKHITFHVARHTHATMMITLGADIYTVSKLLGHTNIQTTQIYAKIVDESKSKAIALIPEIT